MTRRPGHREPEQAHRDAGEGRAQTPTPGAEPESSPEPRAAAGGDAAAHRREPPTAGAPTWRPGAALVVPVDAAIAAGFALPAEASPIVEAGRPALHVTLLSRGALAPVADALAPRWDRVVAQLPPAPPVRVDGRLRRAHDPEGGRSSWYVRVADQASWRAYRLDLIAAIDAALRADGLPSFAADEPDRVFHVTLANDQGGEPYASIGRPWAFEASG